MPTVYGTTKMLVISINTTRPGGLRAPLLPSLDSRLRFLQVPSFRAHSFCGFALPAILAFIASIGIVLPHSLRALFCWLLAATASVHIYGLTLTSALHSCHASSRLAWAACGRRVFHVHPNNVSQSVIRHALLQSAPCNNVSLVSAECMHCH